MKYLMATILVILSVNSYSAKNNDILTGKESIKIEHLLDDQQYVSLFLLQGSRQLLCTASITASSAAYITKLIPIISIAPSFVTHQAYGRDEYFRVGEDEIDVSSVTGSAVAVAYDLIASPLDYLEGMKIVDGYDGERDKIFHSTEKSYRNINKLAEATAKHCEKTDNGYKSIYKRIKNSLFGEDQTSVASTNTGNRDQVDVNSANFDQTEMKTQSSTVTKL